MSPDEDAASGPQRPAPGAAADRWARRPDPGEYEAFYAGYTELVPDGNVLRTLEEGWARTRALLDPLPQGAGARRYAEGKWSVREVVGHMADAERVFAYRALHMARSDPAPLPSMDQELWARGSGAAARPLADLLAELGAVREATLGLFRGLAPEALERRGVASGVEFTVRSVAWIIAGHEIHHRELLRERYLPAIEAGEEDG